MMDFSITQNSMEQTPLAFKFVGSYYSWYIIEDKEWQEEEPCIYPCYSLVEDTETE